MHRIRTTLIPIGIFGVMLSSSVGAQPEIAGVSPEEGATPADGEMITITGQGFGTKPQAAPVLFDRVEDVWSNGTKSTPYSDLADGDPIPTGHQSGYPWDRGNQTSPRYETEVTRPRRSASYHLPAPDSWLEFVRGWPDPKTEPATEYYAHWYFRPGQAPLNAAAHKFHRIWDTTESRSVGIRVSWSYDLLGGNGFISYDNTIPEVRRWNLLEIYHNTETQRRWARLNGSTIHDQTCTASECWFERSSYQGIVPRLLGIDARAESDWPSGSEFWMSDIYLDTTQARVVLCGEPSWKDCRRSVAQIPVAWSDSELRVQLNLGHFGLGGAYLYVIDAAGTVNDPGHRLCAECPDRPTGMAVE